MRSISRTYSALSEAEPEGKPLSFRSVALLYPPKDVLARIRKNHNGSNGDVEPELQSLEPMFDDDRDIDFPISAKEDIRVIIAQDDVGVSVDRILYDSKDTQDGREKALKQTRNSPKISLFRRVGGEEESPGANTFSAFVRPQLPRHTTRSTPTSPKRSQQPTTTPSSFMQSKSSRRTSIHASLADARHDVEIPLMDTTEEVDSWLDCMFGKTQMRYKGAMTKHHVLQRQPRDPLHAHWEKESQRGGFAFSREANRPLPRSRPDELVKLRTQCLLVSRTFAVPLLDADLPAPVRRASAPMDSTPERRGSRTNKTRSTPQFGITIVIPLAKSRPSARHDAGSPDADSLSPLGGFEKSLQELEDPLQAIMKRWQAIDRTLDALQAVATIEICQGLKAQVSAQASGNTIRFTRLVKLESHVFRHSEPIIKAADASIARLVRSFQIPDVMPQGEWNVWRDELLDMTRSRDSKTHKVSLDSLKISFLQTALTAALSTNLSWLRDVVPPQLQSRLRAEEKRLQNSPDVVQGRTIILAFDQNRARHLLFLMAKFLPAPRPQFERAALQDLRSTPKVSALTQGLMAVGNKSGSVNGHAVTPTEAFVAKPVPAFYKPHEPSPGTSPIKRAASLRGELGATKVGAGKIVLPSERGTPAMPIASAPGSSYTTPAGSPEGRPGSSESAQGNLMRHLQRENSGTTSSTDSTGFWNSFRSNTWSLGPRRDSSLTERSDSALGSSLRDQILPGILKNGRSSTGRHGGTKLVRMLEEVEGSKLYDSCDRKDSAFHTRESTPSQYSHTLTASQFEPSSSTESHLQYFYDAPQGMVDVEIFGGSGADQAAGQKIKVPSASQRFPVFHGPESPISANGAPADLYPGGATYDKAAGYLKIFHPDYALQAVKPYTDLLDDIKRAMKAEPSPKIRSLPSIDEFYPVDDWIEVCSTVVVDVDSMTTRRLTLRRHVRYHLFKHDESVALPRQVTRDNGGLQTPTSITSPIEDLRSNQSIKVTRSEDMDSISRTYRRNDQGHKLGWKDKKIVRGEESYAHAQNKFDTTEEQRRPSSDESNYFDAHADHMRENISINDFAQPTNGHVQNGAHVPSGSTHATHSPCKLGASVGDDLSPFIDKQAKAKATKPLPKITTTSRIPKRDAEGKITGWQDVDADMVDEPGLHDLPTSFVDRKRENVTPVLHTQIVEETFKEEIISIPDPAIVHIIENMIASSDSRSVGPSRASSVHGRGHSRSNSLSGSGLLELQHESKRIVEDALQCLITTVETEKHQGPQHRPSVSGGLFSFGRSAPSHTETSILHQSVAKWLG